MTPNGSRKRVREWCLSHGCVPKTTSDTEVILLSYLTFGADFIRDVDGIFSLAIYDERSLRFNTSVL